MPGIKKRIWFVVADSARARFYALNAAGTALVGAGMKDLSAADVRLPARDLKSDKPGRSFSSSPSGTRHAIEPHHDYHKLEKHKFTVGVAEALDKACAAKKFDVAVLVAPKRSLGELRAVLSPRVQKCIGSELAKDLTKHPTDTLWDHLAPIAEKLRRAVA
jgi:protein required for attachment to host cells